MDDVFRTMIVSADVAPLARALAAAIDPAHSTGLWTTPLTDGQAVTHYISSGHVAEAFGRPLPVTEWAYTEAGWEEVSHDPGNPALIVAAAARLDPPVTVTLEQVQALFAGADVSTQGPWEAMGRLGLTIYQEQIDAP